MKIIKYQIAQNTLTHGDENAPNIEAVLIPAERFSDEENLERNIALVKAEAYNGEYTIEDDGVEEVVEQTQEERITELEEALALLLSGVTE